jgi:hypothetical protein
VTIRLNDSRCRTLLLVGVLIPAAVSAGTVQVEGDVGLGHSNNIDRSTLDQRSGNMESVGLRFSVLQDTRRVNADLLGDVAWTHYSDNAYSSKLTGNAVGRIRIGLIEDHLQWRVEDNFGQTRADLFAAPTPENSENVNYFSTGPDLRLGLGSSMDVVLGGRLSLVDYQRSPSDTRRFSAWMGVEHELSTTARLSANVASEWIDPRKNAVSPSYERSALFASYAIDGARTSLRFDAGANRVGMGGDSTTGSLARVQIDRRLGQYSNLILRAGREFTDSGNTLSLDSAATLQIPGQLNGSLVQAAQPFTNTYASAAWSIVGRRTAIEISSGWYDEDYRDVASTDRQRLQMGIQVSMKFAARMQATAGLDYDRDRYDSAFGDSSNMTGRLGVQWSLGRRTGLTGTVERYFYESETISPNVNETRIWLRVRYGVAPDRLSQLK